MSADFGEGRYVVGRKQYRCEMCFGPIPKGEEHYHYKGIYDGDFQDWRAHRECETSNVEDGEYEFMPGYAPMPERVKLLTMQKESI